MKRTTMYGVVMTLAILAIGGTVVACEVRTLGYWKTHPGAWPVDTIDLWADSYSKDAAIDIMKTPTAGDKTYNLFDAVVAAYLNSLGDAGFPLATTQDAFNNAVNWFNSHPVGSGVAASSAAWQEAEPWFNELQAYNSGLRGVPAGD